MYTAWLMAYRSASSGCDGTVPLMAVYDRIRFLWGAFDLTHEEGVTPSYGTSIVTAGASAVLGAGVGVRRVEIKIDRSTPHPSADPAVMHFDWLNTTGGSPDDTWTSGDYTTMETHLDAFITSLLGVMPTGYKIPQYSWYRVGPGIAPPNPAERVLLKTTPLTCSGANQIAVPQVACSLTFRTGIRRSWGRTYMPYSYTFTSSGNLPSAMVDSIASSVDTLVRAADGDGFKLVVISRRYSSALTVEHIEVDDVFDVIRRRRWKASTYKKILP